MTTLRSPDTNETPPPPREGPPPDCGKVLDVPAGQTARRMAKHDHCVEVHGHPSCGSRFRDITPDERERQIRASYGPRNRAGLIGYTPPHRLHGATR